MIRANPVRDTARIRYGTKKSTVAHQLGQSQVSVMQDHYLGRKIDSEDAAMVREIIGRPDAAAAIDEDAGR